MTASHPVFKPVTLPDFQNGNDTARWVALTGTEPSAKKPQNRARKGVAGVASYTFEPTVASWLQEYRLPLKRP